MIDKKIKVFEAFSGYGSQALALERLRKDYPKFDFEVVGISDIEENAITVYNAIHGPTHNYGDISKINWDEVPDFDLFTYSFPCTDISSMGKQEGFTEGSGTRSSLLWECYRTITTKKPKYLLMENVKALTYEQNQDEFNRWIKTLEDLGYSNFYKVLNSLDYGVPQHRERVFMVSVLDKNYQYSFPGKIPLKKTLKDIMEDEVPDRCWVYPDEKGVYSRKRINEMLDGDPPVIDLSTTQWIDLYSWRAFNDHSCTLTTRCYEAANMFFTDKGHLRRPTERECFRLMGIDDDTITKMLSTNLHPHAYYRMAGNSIVVDVMYYIFKKLFVDEYVPEEMSLF